jgi:AraC family transcriptional regulator
LRAPFAARCGPFYGLPLGNADGGPFGIRALAATGREDDVKTHTHEDAHFVLVLSGTYITSAYGLRNTVPAPTLVFNPPGITHRDRFAKGVGTFVTVSLSSTTFRASAEQQPLAHAPMQLCHPDALKSAFRVAREMSSGHDAAVLESAAWELLTAVGPSAQAASGSCPHWAVRAYEAVMDGSSATGIRIGDLARAVGIHPVHLARVFRSAWGCSPGELLRWRRTERAAALLRETTLTTAEIAQEVGFADQSHLTHAFRTRIGLTPSAYRRMFRGYKTERARLE